MSCLDRELLQKYFDNEISLDEKLKIDDHLNQCNECRDQLEQLKQFKNLLNSTHIHVTIPSFKIKRKIKYYRYLSATAVVIFVMLTLVVPSKDNKPLIIAMEEEIYEDPNRLFNDGVVLFTIIENSEELNNEWEDPFNDPNESFNRGEIYIEFSDGTKTVINGS